MSSTIKKYVCPICGGASYLYDVVDFNKCCEELRGTFLPLSGRPIYYALCESCGFLFAPQFADWSVADFERDIYNADYCVVDPDYEGARGKNFANILISLFDESRHSIRHLDYGGGKGSLSSSLIEKGWNSTSYDPFSDKDIAVSSLGKFDLITAIEVFEHVPNIDNLMHDLRMLMSESSVLFFATLLSDGNITKNGRLHWWYASPRNGHVSLFSDSSLMRLAQRHGFSFGSFSNNLHAFFSNIPSWASHILNSK